MLKTHKALTNPTNPTCPGNHYISLHFLVYHGISLSFWNALRKLKTSKTHENIKKWKTLQLLTFATILTKFKHLKKTFKKP